MSTTALALLLASAALHMGWNFLVKRAGEKQVFTWLALVVGPACFAPFVLIGATFPAQIWPYVLASAFVELVYFMALTYAYGKNDFSLVYPLARGAAPALLAVWAVLFLGERAPCHGRVWAVLAGARADGGGRCGLVEQPQCRRTESGGRASRAGRGLLYLDLLGDRRRGRSHDRPAALYRPGHEHHRSDADAAHC